MVGMGMKPKKGMRLRDTVAAPGALVNEVGKTMKEMSGRMVRRKRR